MTDGSGGSTPNPKEIRQSSSTELGISWDDGLEAVYDVRTLRLACPCAVCVDEMTGKRTLDPAIIPEDVRPVRIEGVGRYALRIHWNDGHSTGLYSFRYLHSLGSGGAPKG